MKTIKDELTKKEVCDALGVSSRTVERRLSPKRQVSGEHGLVSVYARADVLRLAEELGRSLTTPEAMEPEVMPGEGATGGATSRGMTRHGSDAAVMARALSDAVEQVAAALRPAPSRLVTVAEAAQESGLSVSVLRRAIKDGGLRVAKGIGPRGANLLRLEDVMHFADAMWLELTRDNG